jgi:hypothetical protein
MWIVEAVPVLFPKSTRVGQDLESHADEVYSRRCGDKAWVV